MCHHHSSQDPHCQIIRAPVVHLTTLSLPSSEKPHASAFSFFSGTHPEPTSIPQPTPPLNIILYQRPSTSYMAITKQTKMLGVQPRPHISMAMHGASYLPSFTEVMLSGVHTTTEQPEGIVCLPGVAHQQRLPTSPHSSPPASPYSVVFDQHSCPDTRSASEPINPNAAPMPEWQPCLPSLLIHTVM